MRKISDILVQDPSQFDPNFQKIITGKKEFNQYRATPQDKIKDGFFPHQSLTHNLMAIVESLIVLSATGTGKTREILGFTEYALRENLNEKMGRPYDDRVSNLNRVIILVPGSAQKFEIRKQLVCGINPSYITEDVLNAKDEKNRNNAIKRNLKKFGYEIHTYRSFANMIRREYPNESDNWRLSRDYSDCIFICDEAHNLSSPDREDSSSTYESIWRLFHVVLRCKFMIVTATPMINGEEELRLLLNLTLPINLPDDFNYVGLSKIDKETFFRDLPKNVNLDDLSREEANRYFTGQIPPWFSFRKSSKEQIEPYIRGRCVYVRALDTGAVPVYIGEPINEEVFDKETGKTFIAKTIIYKSTMSTLQSSSYFNKNDQNDGAIYSNEIQKSIFVFPDGSISTSDPNSGFKRFVNRSHNKFSATYELNRYLRDIRGIYTLGCKIGEIVDMTMNLPLKDFVYCPWVELGLIPLALSLEAQGFQRFLENRSVFTTEGNDLIQPYCDVPNMRRSLKPDFPKMRRYAIIYGDTDDKERDTIMETFNSYENRYGDLIKIILVSRVGRDGINLADVKRGHLLVSGWNEAVNYQARSRIVRATSHVYLLEDEKERLRRLGKDPSEAKFEIELYNHVAIASLDGYTESVDLLMYVTAETKDRETHRLLRYMKQAAIGCNINYLRNVRPTDVDYSQECDYDICQYKCDSDDVLEKDYDYTTYDIRYGNQLIPTIIEQLKDLFHYDSQYSYDNIIEVLPEFQETQIQEALMTMINQNISIEDQLGYISYLRRNNNHYYLVRDLFEDDPLGNFYANPIIIDPKPIQEHAEQIDVSDIGVIIYELRELFREGKIDQLDNTLNKLSIESQVLVLEDAINEFYSLGDNSGYILHIIKRYRRMLFSFNEPVTEIQELKYKQLQGVKKRGKKAKDPEKIKIINLKNKELDQIIDDGNYEDPNGQPVIVHILYSQSVDRTKYSKTAKFNKAEGRIRVYHLDTNEWVDVPNLEVPVYNRLIQIKNREKIRPLEEFGVYGILDIDGTFRIRNRLMEQQGAEDNGRKVKRGKDCRTWKRQELIDTMWDIQADVSDKQFPDIPADERDTLIKFLTRSGINKTEEELETWETKKLIYYAIWYYDWVRQDAQPMTIEGICTFLQGEFDRKGIMAYQ